MYENLKEALRLKGISAYKLSKMSKINMGDLYTALKGKKPMYPNWKKRIAEALDTDVESLFSEEIMSEKEKILLEISGYEEKIEKLKERMNKFYGKSMERNERFYKLINDFISECEKRGIKTDFTDDSHTRTITIGIEKDGAAAALSYPKKIAYFEYDIADIEQGLSDMFQLFAKKYEEKNHGRKIL